MQDRHSGTAIAIHWATAGLVLAMLCAGLVMTNLGAASGLRLWLTRLHILGGLTVGALTLARMFNLFIAERVRPLPMGRLHRAGAVSTRVLLYVLLIALLLSGFSTLATGALGDWLTGEDPLAPVLDAVPARRWHEWLSRGYVALLVLHIGGVLLHHARTRNVLQRMGLATSPLPPAGGSTR